MIYIAGQVFGNFVFAMSLRMARGRQYHYLTVGTINYAIASVLAVGWVVLNGIPALDLTVIILGAINGLQYQISLVVLFTVVELVGIGITFGIIRLSVALPTLASIFLWGSSRPYCRLLVWRSRLLRCRCWARTRTRQPAAAVGTRFGPGECCWRRCFFRGRD